MTTETRGRGRPRTAPPARTCQDCGEPVTGASLRCQTCWGISRRKAPETVAEENEREAPGSRGPVKGTKYSRTIAKVCPAPKCPRNGEPFMATAKRIYCSQPCTKRASAARLRPSYYLFPDSSNVAGLYYDPRASELVATFKGDNWYTYSKVTEEVWAELISEAQTSIGKAFDRLIRKGRYEFRRLDRWSTSYEPVTISAESPGPRRAARADD